MPQYEQGHRLGLSTLSTELSTGFWGKGVQKLSLQIVLTSGRKNKKMPIFFTNQTKYY